MAIEFGVEISGALKAALRFEKFPEQARKDLAEPIKNITARLAGKVRARVPHGDTNSLEGLVIEQFYNDRDQVSGRVTFSDEYAKVGALEYGAPGKRSRDKVQEHKAKLGHLWGLKLKRPLIVMIAAHKRQVHLNAEKFLRGPLADIGPEALAEIRTVVQKSMDDGT